METKEEYEYDANNVLIKEILTDADDNKTIREYKNDGKLLKETYTYSSDSNGYRTETERTTEYTYDDKDNLIKKSYRYSYEYTTGNYSRRESNTEVTSYTYDEFGNITNKKYTKATENSDTYSDGTTDHNSTESEETIKVEYKLVYIPFYDVPDQFTNHYNSFLSELN